MSESAPRRKGGARRHARERCIRALYHWQLNPVSLDDLIAQYVTDADGLIGNSAEDIDTSYLVALLTGVVNDEVGLSEMLDRFLDRPQSQLNPLERGILLTGLYELTGQPDVPWRVIINEAIDLARVYGAEGGHRYVNAVLDKAAAVLRKAGETT